MYVLIFNVHHAYNVRKALDTDKSTKVFIA